MYKAGSDKRLERLHQGRKQAASTVARWIDRMVAWKSGGHFAAFTPAEVEHLRDMMAESIVYVEEQGIEATSIDELRNTWVEYEKLIAEDNLRCQSAYDAGVAAREDGKPQDACTYRRSDYVQSWLAGFNDEERPLKIE
jgi:ribosome modulation factor